jgi:cation transport regulator ChaB
MPKAMLKKLPDKARDIYEAAWEAAQKAGHDDETAAKIAVTAVKRAGYSKDDETGMWAKMHMVHWHITKATLDEGIMRWHGTVSKFSVDVQGDQITPEFIKYAGNMVRKGHRPAPVVCLSHIDYGKPSDAWVVGDTDEIYVDGRVPKAKGTFRDTPLGKAAFASVRDDIQNDAPQNERSRFSMGFYDEGSQIIKSFLPDGQEAVGRRYHKGWIKHLALTRVPVVKETSIQATLEEKGMAKKVTKREDAASIVGDELADELVGAAEKADLEDTELILKQEEDELEEAPIEEKAEENEEEEAPPVEDEKEGEEEEAPEEEKADLVTDPGATRRDQVRSLLALLETLLLEGLDEQADEANRAALGSPGTNPPTTVEMSQAGTGEPLMPEDTAAVAFVDDWAFRVKAVLVSDEWDRTQKFEALQHALNDFGEGVKSLVTDQTPPSGRDMAEVIAEAVRRAVEPVYNELAGVKAELAEVMQGQSADPRSVQNRPGALGHQPRAMDGRAVVMPDQNQPTSMPQGLGQGTALRHKAMSASELAWQSTAEGNPLGR